MEVTAAPAMTAAPVNQNFMLQTGLNNRSRGSQLLEPPNNPITLNNFFDSDYLLGDLDLSTPNPLLQSTSNIDRPVAPTQPTFVKPDGTRAQPSVTNLDQPPTNIDQAETPQANVFSRLGSPLPSLHSLIPDMQTRGVGNRELLEPGTGPCWKVSQADYVELQASVTRHSELLPRDFVLPTRHTMSAYLERCINSLYKHQPCFHVPTFRVGNSSLELILAMCATGAQLRFESHLGMAAFHASKALIMSRLRERHEETVVQGLKGTSLLPTESMTTSSQSPTPEDDSFNSNPQSNENQYQATSMSPGRKQRLQTMQAILTLMSFGSWGPKGLLGETLILQSVLVMLAREEGLGQEADAGIEDCPTALERWHRWIDVESWRRIKTITYTFTNLQSLAYNVCPPLLTAEVHCITPASADEWAATSPHRLEEIQRTSSISAVPLQAAFQDLFRQETAEAVTNPARPSISAFGNYALIFGILQCISSCGNAIRCRSPVLLTQALACAARILTASSARSTDGNRAGRSVPNPLSSQRHRQDPSHSTRSHACDLRGYDCMPTWVLHATLRPAIQKRSRVSSHLALHFNDIRG